MTNVSAPSGAVTPIEQVRPAGAAVQSVEVGDTSATARLVLPIAIETDCVLAEKSRGRRDAESGCAPATAGMSTLKIALVVEPLLGEGMGCGNGAVVLPPPPQPVASSATASQTDRPERPLFILRRPP